MNTTDAVARYHARHAEADDIQHNMAAFVWNGSVYEVTVCGYIVGMFRTLAEVMKFSDMHNSRIG